MRDREHDETAPDLPRFLGMDIAPDLDETRVLRVSFVFCLFFFFVILFGRKQIYNYILARTLRK